MTRKQALADLIAKVEAGDVVASDLQSVLCISARQAVALKHGSLDAALALHEAVLPGWGWYRQGFVMFVTDDHTGWGSKPHFSARDDKNPARAWLLAILKALHAQEGEG